MSKVNHEEADLIVAFYVYLNQNGMAPKDITILTFYNGQRKLIFRKLREQPLLRGERFKIVTVDSYQGEENEVVLLSLVRSNEKRRIGFLSIENRVCVAISRARRGFYLFGDAENLCKSSMLWWEIVQAMAKTPNRVGFHLPLTCSNHGNVTFVSGRRTLLEDNPRSTNIANQHHRLARHGLSCWRLWHNALSGRAGMRPRVHP